jgi:tetratricopeptide (TPR) repeat protein
VVQIDPQFAPGYHHLGLVELKTRNYQKAFGYLSKAVELDAGLVDAQIDLGKLLLTAKKPDKAMERAQLVLKGQFDHAAAIQLKAAVLLSQEKVSDAQGLLDGLLARREADADGYALMALSFQRQKNTAKAKEILASGVAAHPGSVRLLLMTAGICARAKDMVGAEKAMQQVIALDPDQLIHRFNLAEMYWQAGKQPKAEQVIEALVAKDAFDAETRITAARFYLRHSRLESAEQLLRASMEKLPEHFEMRFALSEVQLRRHRPAEAVETLRGCLKLDAKAENPEIIRTKNLLAKALLVQGNFSRAEALVTEILEVDPRGVDVHLIKGRLHMLRKQSGDAVSAFRTVVAERPEFVEGHLCLAEAYLLKDERELALDTLHSATKTLPGSKVLHRALAKVYVAQNDAVNAEKHLQRLRVIDPDDHSVYASLGDLFAAGGQPEKAEAQYQMIREQAPEDPLGHLKLSQLYSQQKRRKDAVQVLAQAVSDHPKAQVLLASLVKAHLTMNNADAAAAVCRKQLARDPDQVFVHNLLAVVQIQQKQYNEAEKTLERAIALKPEWPLPYNNLARLYLLQGHPEKAIGRFKAALSADPRNTSAYMILGKIYEQQEDYANAMAIYEQALKAQPALWAAANNLAFLLSEFGQGPQCLTRAMRLGLKASDLRPEDPMVQDTVAWISFKQGNVPMARQILEDALTKAPDDPVLNYHLGAVLVENGSRIEARERLSAALTGDQVFVGRQAAEKLLAGLNQ